jgi:hypothetical protein
MCIDLNKKYLCKGRVGYKLIIIRWTNMFVFFQSSPNLVMEVDENDEQSIIAPCCFRHFSAAWSSAGLTAGPECISTQPA